MIKDTNVQHIPIDLIDYPKIAMRSAVDGDDMEDLMKSISEVGLLEPIIVRELNGRYEIIAGHRRTRAVKHLKLPTIEAKIVLADDNEVLLMRLAENLSRHDVDPVDEATFIGEIMLEKKLSPEQVAELLKRRLEWVEERLEVFSMRDYLQAYVKQKRIPLGAALWINRIGNEKQKIHYSHWAGQHGVSVRGAKYWYDLWKAQPDISDIPITDIKDIGSREAQKEATVFCERCGATILMQTARNVWVHAESECPPPLDGRG